MTMEEVEHELKVFSLTVVIINKKQKAFKYLVILSPHSSVASEGIRFRIQKFILFTFKNVFESRISKAKYFKIPKQKIQNI